MSPSGLRSITGEPVRVCPIELIKEKPKPFLERSRTIATEIVAIVLDAE
jgi:hypothetical protein